MDQSPAIPSTRSETLPAPAAHGTDAQAAEVIVLLSPISNKNGAAEVPGCAFTSLLKRQELCHGLYMAELGAGASPELQQRSTLSTGRGATSEALARFLLFGGSDLSFGSFKNMPEVLISRQKVKVCGNASLKCVRHRKPSSPATSGGNHQHPSPISPGTPRLPPALRFYRTRSTGLEMPF